MTAPNPVIARYVQAFRAALSGLPEGEREEIVREIEDHVADAIAAGRPIDEVLTTLGPAETLARAYTVELAMNSRTRTGTLDRALTLIGLVAVASVPSFIVCSVLLAFGCALAASGLAVFIAGIAALVRPDLVPDLKVAPWVCVVAGPLMAAVGGVALYVLFLYARFMVRLTRRTIERVSGKTAS